MTLNALQLVVWDDSVEKIEIKSESIKNAVVLAFSYILELPLCRMHQQNRVLYVPLNDFEFMLWMTTRYFLMLRFWHGKRKIKCQLSEFSMRNKCCFLCTYKGNDTMIKNKKLYWHLYILFGFLLKTYWVKSLSMEKFLSAVSTWTESHFLWFVVAFDIYYIQLNL